MDNISAAVQKVSNTTIVTESASGQTHVNAVKEVKTKADLHTDHATHMHLAKLILMLDTATDMTSMMKMIDLLDSSKTKTHVNFSTRYVLKYVLSRFFSYDLNVLVGDSILEFEQLESDSESLKNELSVI